MSDFIIYDLDNSPEDARESLADTQGNYGFVPNLFGGLAESSVALEAYLSLDTIFKRSRFSSIERHVLLLTISRFHACAYCISAHSTEADMEAAPESLIEKLRNNEALDDPKLETLRAFTIDVLKCRGQISDQTLVTFFKAGYEKEHVLEVITAIAMKTLSNFTNLIVKTPIDEAFKKRAWQSED